MSVKTIMTCDEMKCTKSIELAGPFFIAKKEAKEKGWTTKKMVDGKWYNFCPECGK